MFAVWGDKILIFYALGMLLIVLGGSERLNFIVEISS